MRITSMIFILCGILLGSCAIQPPPPRMCHFQRLALNVSDTADVGDPSSAALARSEQPAGPFAEAVRSALDTGDRNGMRLAQPQRQALLVLSGGSLNGAYGAGFLDGWSAASPGHRLPTFTIVTGVSTGAILSTFAFTDSAREAVAGYSIERENQLLKPYVKMKNGEPTTMSYLSVLRKGSLGDLAPLRVRLKEAFTSNILNRVADGAREGRKLFVGVVDADSGEAQALDLTEMAKRYSDANTQAERDFTKDCYVEAVVASSSAPLAAAPVFIDNRMLIDGGARFGMFTTANQDGSRRYQESYKNRNKESSSVPDVAPATFLIINGTQTIPVLCGKADIKGCTADDPDGPESGAHSSWSFTKLALRSESILTNQVYRFSEANIGADARLFRVTRISEGVGDHLFTMDDPNIGTGEKTCAAWHEDDERLDQPVQFYPRYMHCLIDFGRKSGAAAHWSEVLNARGTE